MALQHPDIQEETVRSRGSAGPGGQATFRLASTWKQISVIFRLYSPEFRRIPMPSSTKKISSTGGFTIMEVALAATVLALTLTGMIGVIESGSSMLDMSRKQTLAGQILHGEIDQLRLQNWPTITGYTNSNTVDFGVYGYGSSTVMTTSNDPLLAMYSGVYPNTTSI